MKLKEYKDITGRPHGIQFKELYKLKPRTEWVRFYPNKNEINGGDMYDYCLDGDDIEYQIGLMDECEIKAIKEVDGRVMLDLDFTLIPTESEGK